MLKKTLRPILVMTLSVCMVFVFSSCGTSGSFDASKTDAAKDMIKNYDQNSSALKFSSSKWHYDKTHDVYWRTGIHYCAKPETTDYETMGIYVPGKYFDGTKNSDGTYTCKVNKKGRVSGCTAETAPIVFPVNTPGYMAQASPTSYDYSSIKKYLKAGFVYVYAGMRGRENGTDFSGGAPWGVTDLKAAVRYCRFNSSALPGDKDSIFTFGHSGGGAQSSLMGASGDSSRYYKYLTSIGAAMYNSDKEYISDSICGAMCWCPITSLDQADAAYEWNMGQFSSSGTRASGKWTSLLSDDLAREYASYINKLKLKDSDGSTLSLDKSDSGIYLSGTYYDYIVSVIQKSLNNFLKDTDFPYTASSTTMAAGGFGGSMGSSGTAGSRPSGSLPSGSTSSGSLRSGGMMGSSSSSDSGKTYKTAAAYIKALNADGTWIKYDKEKNTAKVLDLKGFVKNCKTPSKDTGAFDALDRSQAENDVFGTDAHDSLHFDSVMSDLINKNKNKYAQKSGWKASYAKAYKKDLTYKDKEGKSIRYRVEMYNPMYYLSDYYQGFGKSATAKYWRINTGIAQGDTALTTETNLALALKQNDNVKKVDFTTVWGQGHTMAERSGNAESNFIKWVKKCVSSESAE